jgi:hypothetical protein
MTGTATTLQSFLREAQTVFGLDSHAGRGANNPHYMSRPLQLSNERLISDETAPENIIVLESPFLFLTGISERGRISYRNEPSASIPSVCLLVGEYGLGKTEFIFQLCDHLRRHTDRRAPAPLPINLSMCRWMAPDPEQILRTAPDWRSFARLLFAPVLSRFPDLGDDFIENELLAAIHGGDVMLILDALDELVTARYQHVHFFEGIRAFLEFAGPYATRFRCLVSMRFEYISAVDTPSGDELVTALRRQQGPVGPNAIHFLHLDFLNDSRIESYLRHTNTMECLVDTLQEYPSFYELLHRPIFLQMTRAIDEAQRTFRIRDLSHPVQFVRAFVEVAGAAPSGPTDAPYFAERDAMIREAGYMWDADLMARRALAKYQRTGGDIAFDSADIASFLVEAPGSEHEGRPPDHEHAMLSVQKCPFLHQYSEDTVVYSHKVFLEYFVSRGILLDMDETGTAFDRLVLNSDMRYFLRFLVDEKYGNKDEWYRRTRKSYALDRPDEWHLQEGGLADIFEALDDIRKTLLDSMTEPRRFDNELARSTIRRFFEYEGLNLHPRYLMYNYEGVAVYLWRHRWQQEDLWLLHEFSDRLINRARDLAFELDSDDMDDREGYELLAERILSIARRLRLTEITRISLENFVVSDDIRSRMNTRARAVQAEQ